MADKPRTAQEFAESFTRRLAGGKTPGDKVASALGRKADRRDDEARPGKGDRGREARLVDKLPKGNR
jgi:hypothetical protein